MLTFKAVSKSGETVYISDAKGSCKKGQTSTSKATDGSGTLVFTAYSKFPVVLNMIFTPEVHI